MNITSFSDYSLRVLIYLSVHGEANVSAEVIADAYDISFHHVAKAAQWLSREGYVISERGRGGGMRLSRAAAEINIGEVLRASETGTALAECMRGDGGACVITPSCGLKHALAAAEEAFYAALDAFTLADITREKTALSELLGLSA